MPTHGKKNGASFKNVFLLQYLKINGRDPIPI